MAHEDPLHDLRRDIACIKREVEAYKPMLDRMVKAEREREKLRRAIIEKTVVGAVWALAAFVIHAAWQSLMEYLRR